MVDVNKMVARLTHEQEEKHAASLAAHLGLSYINLKDYPFTKEILDTLPEDQAKKFQIIPYLKVGKNVKIGLVRPADPEALGYLKTFSASTGLQFVTTVISPSSFDYGIESYEEVKREAKPAVNTDSVQHDESFADKIQDITSVSKLVQEVSTTKLLDVLLVGAAKVKASDIHMEPEETGVLVRYRVDGILQDVVKLTLSHHRQLLSRIKFLSQLRMDISDKPQDGRFTFKDSSFGNIDLRVSLMPSSFGESVVMRLLGQEKSILSLDKLGFREDALVAVREAISKPNGMILTSGPTGSGKSSTLYAILMEVKTAEVKIITLEDPVEYRIEGIEQSQVNPEGGYKFADGLRASLRQDPDILMVGEIRDAETAEIAVQSALTGHLLISTIHANSAPAVYVRLLEMGVKPFLLSGSINLVMAQRLIRKICPSCREEYEPRLEVWQEMKTTLQPIANRLSPDIQAYLKAPMIKLIHGKGCEKCNKTGYLGRQVVIETLVPDSVIEDLITSKASIAEFEKAAKTQGMITMEQDGLIKVLHGETTVEEVWRVTKD